MAGHKPVDPKYRDIVESKRYEQELKESGLNPVVCDRLFEGACWALPRDPTLRGRAIPPSSSKASGGRWTLRIPRLNAADPVVWLYYTFDKTTLTFEGIDFEWPPESHRL